MRFLVAAVALVACGPSSTTSVGTGTTSTTDTASRAAPTTPTVELSDDCAFTYSEEDCPVRACTVELRNPTTEYGWISAGCNDPTTDTYDQGLIFWPVGEERLNAMSAYALEPQSTAVVEVWYQCTALASFEAPCRIKVDGDDDQVGLDFTVTGTYAP